MLVAGFSQFNKPCLSTKKLLFWLRAAATANLGAAALLVLVPCAAWGLVSLWAALDSSRAVACIGPAVRPSGHAGLVRHVARSLKYGASPLVVMSHTPR